MRFPFLPSRPVRAWASARTPAWTPTLTPTRLAFVTVVIAATAAFSLAAQAHPAGPPPGGGAMPMMMMFGPGPHLERMLDAINASTDQRSQIKAILESARTDQQAQRDSGRMLQADMATLFTQPTVDARAAEVLRQKMLAQTDAATRRGMQAMLDISRVLGVEQRQTLVATMAEQRKAMLERHHDGGAAAPK